jgi:hypothetical protein
MIEPEIQDDTSFMPLVKSLEICRRFLRNENQDGLWVGVGKTFQKNGNPIIESPMQELWPEPEWVSGKIQFRLNPAQEFGENNVYGNYVRIQAIRPRAEDNVMLQPAETTVPSTPDMVRRKPPDEIEEVGPGQLWDAMPGDRRRINIFDLLTIDMDLEFVSKLRDPLDYDALGAVALIKERRYNRQPRLMPRNSHPFTPARIARMSTTDAPFATPSQTKNLDSISARQPQSDP